MADCLFCKIIEKKIPAKFDLEEEELVAIQDVNPQAPIHSLIIPKRHVDRISALKDKDGDLVGKMVLAAKRLAEMKQMTDYRLVFNNGPGAGQTVFHIHLHILGNRTMTWPPG